MIDESNHLKISEKTDIKLVGNSNDPPRKNVESHNCVIPYTILSWIETSQNLSLLVETGQQLSKLVKTGQNWSKLVKTGQN